MLSTRQSKASKGVQTRLLLCCLSAKEKWPKFCCCCCSRFNWLSSFTSYCSLSPPPNAVCVVFASSSSRQNGKVSWKSQSLLCVFCCLLVYASIFARLSHSLYFDFFSSNSVVSRVWRRIAMWFLYQSNKQQWKGRKLGFLSFQSLSLSLFKLAIKNFSRGKKCFSHS